MSRHHSLDYIEIYVTDMTKAQSFYKDAFGWNFTDYAPEYAGIQKPDGNGEVGGLCQVDKVVTGGALLVLYSNDLNGTMNSVVESGGEITKDIFEFPGGSRFQFKDPSGNELAVWCEQKHA